MTDEIGAILTDRYGTAAAAEYLPRVERSVFSASGDTSGDLLYGGEGDDIVIGGDRDIMVGGEGSDAFGVYVTGGMSPTVITDFDPATETLEVVIPPRQDWTITLLDMQTANFAQAVAVVVDSVIVALLPDVFVADIDPASVTLRELA